MSSSEIDPSDAKRTLRKRPSSVKPARSATRRLASLRASQRSVTRRAWRRDKREIGQQAGRLGGVAVANRGYAEPVADLEGAQLPVRIVQPGCHRGSARWPHRRCQEAARCGAASSPDCECSSRANIIDRAIVDDPGHPGAKMISRLVDGGEELLRVVSSIRPEQDARAAQLRRQVDQGRHDRFGHRIRL